MNTSGKVLAAAALVFATTGAAESGNPPYQGDGHILMTQEALEWRDVASMAPGAQMAVIEGKPSEAEPFTFRLKLPADYRIDPHTHPEYERVTVLSGTLHFAHGDAFDRARTQALPAGSVAIMAPGEPMYGYTEEETVLQLHGTGPWGIQYVNPEDDPRH